MQLCYTEFQIMYVMFQMMAFRVRVLHSLVLTIVGVSFIVYSSYYAYPVQLLHVDNQIGQSHQGKSETSSTMNYTILFVCNRIE